jgi:hypothetical protein
VELFYDGNGTFAKGGGHPQTAGTAFFRRVPNSQAAGKVSSSAWARNVGQ